MALISLLSLTETELPLLNHFPVLGFLRPGMKRGLYESGWWLVLTAQNLSMKTNPQSHMATRVLILIRLNDSLA